MGMRWDDGVSGPTYRASKQASEKGVGDNWTFKRAAWFMTWEGIREEKEAAPLFPIKKPFELRYNPYTQTVQTLSSGGKILDIAKQIKGDVFLISNAIKKIQDNEKDADVDFEQICRYLDVQKI